MKTFSKFLKNGYRENFDNDTYAKIVITENGSDTVINLTPQEAGNPAEFDTIIAAQNLSDSELAALGAAEWQELDNI